MSSQKTMNFCPNCGTKAIPNAKFCIECGISLIIKEEMQTTSERRLDFQNIQTETSNAAQNIVKTQPIQENYQIQNEIKEENNHIPQKQTFIETENNPENSEDNILDYSYVLDEVSNEPVNYLDEIVNYTDMPCPSCGTPMQMNQTSKLLSKIIHYSCRNCKIIFKESKNYLVLEQEPQNTRLSNKLHLKRYNLQQWHDILSGNYTPDETKYFQKLKFESPTALTCPICYHPFDQYTTGGLTSYHYLICSGCALILNIHPNNHYTLANCVDTYSPLWQYEKSLLTLDDMKKIIDNAEPLSKEYQQKREAEIQKHNAEIQKRDLIIQHQKEDLAEFDKSLTLGTPMLPTPRDLTIVLKKNEKPIYKLEDVSFSEPRAVRTSNGGYGGVSVRITKGVTLHSGRVGSTSESHDEIKNIDNGDFLITNKRIIFLGSNRTINIDLNKIVSVSNEYNTIQIQRSNKQKPEYFGNIKTTEHITVENRGYDIDIDASMIKKLIIGLIQ